MKNKFAITTIILLIVCVTVAFAACDNDKSDIGTPENLAMSGNVLSWQSVDGADSYDVEVNGKVVGNTKSTTYFVEIEEKGTYNIRVRAKVGEKVSDFSEVYTYIVKEMLAKPVATFDEESKTVSWGAVEGAVSYTVRVRYTDKQISAEGAVIEMAEGLTVTSYKLEKEEYTKPGSFTIEVMAIADENSESSNSPFSEACIFVIDAQLAAPTLSSITSTRVYWNSVANATSYYLEVRNVDDPEEVYSTTVKATTSTSVSVLLSNFNIETPGKYTVHIQTIGDGEVYKSSEITDANEDFVIYKLAQLEEGCISLVDNQDGTVNAVWRVTAEQLKNVTSFTLVLTPYDEEGDAVLSAQRISFNLESTSDMEKLTVTEDGEYTVYSYCVDKMFVRAEGDTEDPLKPAYYGKRFTVELSSSKSGSGVIAGTSVKAEEQYLSYKIPTIKDGWYQVGSAAELAYIVKNPSASYKLTANIDYEGYEWMTLESFSGNFDGGVYIISDIKIIGNGDKAGFFGEIAQGASVTGLKLVDVTIDNEEVNYSGAIAAVNNGTVADCVVVGSVKASIATAGGLVGVNNGTVRSSQSSADVTAAIAGGVAGINSENATISYSSARGNVTSSAVKNEDEEKNLTEAYAGGFVAVNDGTILYGSSIGNVSSNSEITLSKPNYAGGFVAVNNGTVSYSYSGANYSNDSSKRNSVSSKGNVNIAVGGFVGYNTGNISSSYSNVKASSPNYLGGFVGYNASGKIENSYSIGGVNIGTISGEGGFVGFNAEGATVENVYYYDKELGDSANRTDKELSEYVEIGDIGLTLAEKLGGNFAVIGGENGIRNAVLKGVIYNVTTSLTISPGGEIKATVQYVDNNGELQTITAGNESSTGSTVCGNQSSDGTVIIIFSNGSARGLVIVTVD